MDKYVQRAEYEYESLWIELKWFNIIIYFAV